MHLMPMPADRELEVRALFKACHPNWPEQPAGFYDQATRTIVALDGDELVGFTGYSLEMSQDGVRVMVGRDVCVSPTHQGKGLGMALCLERLRIAKVLGMKAFVGSTDAEGNEPMRRLFEKLGAHYLKTIAGPLIGYEDRAPRDLYAIYFPENA